MSESLKLLLYPGAEAEDSLLKMQNNVPSQKPLHIDINLHEASTIKIPVLSLTIQKMMYENEHININLSEKINKHLLSNQCQAFNSTVGYNRFKINQALNTIT